MEDELHFEDTEVEKKNFFKEMGEDFIPNSFSSSSSDEVIIDQSEWLKELNESVSDLNEQKYPTEVDLITIDTEVINENTNLDVADKVTTSKEDFDPTIVQETKEEKHINAVAADINIQLNSMKRDDSKPAHLTFNDLLELNKETTRSKKDILLKTNQNAKRNSPQKSSLNDGQDVKNNANVLSSSKNQVYLSKEISEKSITISTGKDIKLRPAQTKTVSPTKVAPKKSKPLTAPLNSVSLTKKGISSRSRLKSPKKMLSAGKIDGAVEKMGDMLKVASSDQKEIRKSISEDHASSNGELALNTLDMEILERSVAELNQQLAQADNKTKELQEEVKNLKLELEKKDFTLNSQSQQIQFLETRLDEEMELKAPSKLADSAPAREISELETLVRGYQTENEKLVLKIKELKSSSIENDKRNFLKLETLQKENSYLKTQLDMHEKEKKSRYAIDITKEKVRSEEMELKINELEYRVQIKKDELTALNKIHEAQCDDYEKRIAEIAEQSTKELKEKFKIDLDQHKTYILELESKMEWNLENQQVFSDAESRIKRYEDAIAEFHRLVESSSEVDDEARNPKDISKIKLLESQLENLEQEMKQKSTFPELKVFTEAQRPEISADKSVQILKRRIVTLENEKMDMLGKVQKSEHYADQLKLENDHMELKIKGLESKVFELKQLMSQPPKHNLAIDESKWVPRTTVDELIRKVQQEEAKLKNRIVELEAEIRGLKPDNSYMLNTLNSKLLEKELLCANLETKCNQLEKKMLELVNNSDVSSIKEAMKNALLENENLKLKIELLHGSRDSMQETTMQILKQTQLQSSKLAFVYSQNTMEMMKREWLKEYELKGEHSKKKCREKINNLEKQISNLKSALENSVIEKNRYSERLATLNKEYNELHSVHLHCESRIENIRNGVMPSLQDFDRLSEKLHSLEGISKAREENLRYSLEMKHSKVKKDFESYKVEISKKLNQKNNQIKEFQTEINSLVSMIGALKKEMLCPMNTNINKT